MRKVLILFLIAVSICFELSAQAQEEDDLRLRWRECTNCWSGKITVGNVEYKHIKPGDNPDTPSVVEEALTDNSPNVKIGDFLGIM